MAARRTILLAVAAMAVLSTPSAAIYNVGEPGGAWDLSTNYGTWASSRNFQTSDQIVYKYSPRAHDVLEVSKIDVMPGSSSTSPAPASGPSASNAPPPTPVSAATNVEATGFGLAVLLAIAGLMA
ncbi:unnamed protein product [Triticum turgidum subsp. durum]|uniref:Phytocyanin domain-containing protein n=1 Tax=Triticum turgidum subsp. durum TaxID=4567 RepID=A0A9R1RU44_TRITD|nr:unnamed protein product [Triticum turgidum subsp. durum]